MAFTKMYIFLEPHIIQSNKFNLFITGINGQLIMHFIS